MTKKLFLPLALLAACVLAPSCNKSDDIEYEYEVSSSVMVTAFSLKDNNKVLDSLSNVFFSIDLVNAKIFNADSLPYGTNVSRLVPEISAPATASKVTIEFPRENKGDSIVDYLKTTTDSIDFSLGPVKLRVVSQSTTVERVYEIKVNVHQVKPDTLVWSQVATGKLPTTFAMVDAQSTLEKGGKHYCLTSRSGAYCLAQTADPASGEWDMASLTLPFTPDVESLRATTEHFYMLSTDGDLYRSADATSWESTSCQWSHIYGAYGEQMLGCKQSAGEWTIEAYPSGQSWAMPAGFPVSGTSQTVTFDTQMAYTPQLVMLGGRDAAGQVSSAVWGFDGSTWVKISRKEIPQALEGVMLVPYDLFKVSSSDWAAHQYPALLAIGGRTQDGTINGTVYYSGDWGMTWKKGPTTMQLPKGLPWVYGASTFVYATTMHADSRANDGWTWLELPSLPPQCRLLMPWAESRVDKPLTEWECPAIYLYGGHVPSGQTINSAWRGMILRYTFQPVY